MILIVTLLLSACSSNGGRIVNHGCDPAYIPPSPSGYLNGAPVYEFLNRIEQKRFEKYNSKACKKLRQQQMKQNYLKLIKLVEGLDKPETIE